MLGRFLWHWWVRRKRLNQNWTVGIPNGISQSEFRRLIVTVLCVILVYFPLSLIPLVAFPKAHKVPFSFKHIHGPMWKFIVFEPQPKAPWGSWIGIFLAIASFALIGLTRNARQFYEHCIEWIYDHIPQKYQARFPFMRNISEKCKERRSAKWVLNGNARSGRDVGYIR